MSAQRTADISSIPSAPFGDWISVTALGVDSFNIDDRCAQVLGSPARGQASNRGLEVRTATAACTPD
jgi:hypothetical protein